MTENHTIIHWITTGRDSAGERFVPLLFIPAVDSRYFRPADRKIMMHNHKQRA